MRVNAVRFVKLCHETIGQEINVLGADFGCRGTFARWIIAKGIGMSHTSNG